MQTMIISQFKAHALEVIANVAKTKKSIIITKRGKPIAKLIPYQDVKEKNKPGKLADTLVFEKDIVTPLDKEMWESCQ